MRLRLLLLLIFIYVLIIPIPLNSSQESDDNSNDFTTVSVAKSMPTSRGRRRCATIRDFSNGWMTLRSRGRIAKFMCNKGFQLIGNRVLTCIQGKWNNVLPVCVDMRSSSGQLLPITTTSSPLNSAVTAKFQSLSVSELNSKTSTMNPLFTTPVINMSVVSNDSSNIFVESSKISLNPNLVQSHSVSPIETTIIRDMLFTTTAIPSLFTTNSEITAKTQSTVAVAAHQSLLSSTESSIKSKFTTLMVTDMSSVKSTNNILSTKIPNNLKYTQKQFVLSTVLPLQGSPNLTSNNSLNNEFKGMNKEMVIVSDGIAIPTSTSKSQDSQPIIESKTRQTTAVKPITSVSNIWTNHTKDLDSGNQSTRINSRQKITTLVTISTFSSSTSSHTTSTYNKTRGPMVVTPALSNHNITNNFDINSNRHTITTTTKPKPIPSISVTFNALRRRRRPMKINDHLLSGAKHLVNNSNNELNTSLSICVSIILMAIITTTLTFYVINKKINNRQNRLSEDSEMRYLSPNDVVS
ncbi:probable maltase-glucoamylase 2 [Oppia nitens]|uniref:probable maltase-glucoamylase 2 n=1 Tax=Oppia nitens TaxID=1686743 RepID=UPI0023DC2459|nr:probable maltase-glucoamylase 2 [Oppia nitens]